MLNLSSFLSIGQNDKGVYLSRPVAVAIASQLIQCDIIGAEVTKLTNTLQQREIMTKIDNMKLADAFLEIDKRDDLIDIYKQGLANEEKISKELRKELVKERRRNRFNKWIYFVGGAGIGIIGTKQILK